MSRVDAARDAWRERAAIMEYDGGLPRSQAETEAWSLVALEFGTETADAARVAEEQE